MTDGVAAAMAGWREAERAATSGPWISYGIGDDEIWSEEPWDHVAETMGNTADAHFIATARTAFPRLLAAVEAVLKLHQRNQMPLCRTCRVRWPCPTYRAITTALTGQETSDAR